MSVPDFPKRLEEKLRTLRERTGLSPDELAAHVKAKDGSAIESYESGAGDPPVSVLYAYAKLSGISIDDILDDEREV